MRPARLLACWFACLAGLAKADAPAPKLLSSAQILAASSASDWRRIDDENLMLMSLPKGQVLIELAPAFAPRHVANVKALVREKYFDGLAVMRVQDNYVAQWGDAEAKKPIKSAQKTLPAEFFRKLDDMLAFTPLGDADTYGPEVGFSNGLPAVRDVARGEAWLAHCYAMVGAGRDNAPDSGGGTELYAVIGHAPRHLDRNVTLLGRVVQGIDLLSSLPRGTEALGFYKSRQQRVPVSRVRIAADLPLAQRPALEALRTDTVTWAAYVDARRHRREDWFIEPTGHIEVCNVPLPIRMVAK
ncbi:MAG: peptidylprolyl isomerase [Pseudomonadota bacterium]